MRRLERVPGGRCDRSLARSAWDSATQKCRPVGYGVIRAGVRTDSMIGVTKFRIRKNETETWRTCGREIPLGFAAPDHTVPYGTVLSRDAFPGTSCQATIGVVPPGRAGRHFATASSESLLRIVPEGRCDRSLARSGKNATQKSRPVGYGVIEYQG